MECFGWTFIRVYGPWAMGGGMRFGDAVEARLVDVDEVSLLIGGMCCNWETVE
jgi:hypothetical protein